jgi:hypothetical protein
MRQNAAALILFLGGAAACGETVVVEVGPDPWGAAPGEAGALPPSGSSPSDPPWTEDTDAWSGWWVRFPCYRCASADLAVAGDDVIITGSAHAVDLDLGAWPLAADVDPGDTVGFVARVSGNGELAWASQLGPAGGPEVAVDAAGLVHVTGEFGLRTLTAEGDSVEDKSFGLGTHVESLSATSDGGLLLGVRVEGDFALGGEPIEFTHESPAGVLLRLDSERNALWWREVSVAGGFVGVGEDRDGRILAVTNGGKQADWGDLLIDSGITDDVLYVAAFDEAGDSLWGTAVSGIHSDPQADPMLGEGLLVTGGARNALTVGTEDVPYGDPPGYEDKGVVLRLDGSGTLHSYLSFGPGPYSAASGPEALIVASSMNADPLRLLWCADGVEPCDAYTLAETEAYGDLVAVNAKGINAYMTGLFRLTPGGSLGETSQLYLMKLGH